MIAQFIKSAQSWETALFCWCLSRKHASEIALISRQVSHTGDGHLYLLAGLAAYYFEKKFGTQFLETGLIAFAIELPIYLVLKNLIKRDRPSVTLKNISAFIIPSDKFSFPSGHTAAAFLMASIASYYYPHLCYPCITYASLIGISRILLGVHYPSDIIAGACLGTISAFAGIGIVALT
jgi:undecaprenyl-diphosphatase